MRISWSTLFRTALAVFIAIGVLMVDAPGASANVRIERGGDVPFYARFQRGYIYHTDDWAVFVFYRPPTCVRSDFNLLDFFDIPAAFGCTPPTTAGFEIWEHGLDLTSWPRLAETEGLGAVPVWFINWTALQAAIDDDVLTIGELESLNPLVGSASSYHETLNLLPQKLKLIAIAFNAKGTLEDGRSFQLTATGNDRFTETRIIFR